MKKRILKIIIVLILCCSFAVNIFADTEVEDTEVEDTELDDAMEEFEKIQDEKQAIEQEKNQLESEKNSKQKEANSLSSEISSITSEIEELTSEKQDKEMLLAEIEEQIEQAKLDEIEQIERSKKRIKYMYENGDSGYLDVIFSAESFSDMLNKLEYVEKIMEYDKNILTNIKNLREEIENKEKQLIQEQEELVEIAEELDSQVSSLEVKLASKESEVSEVSGEINSVSAELKDLEAAENATNDLIISLGGESQLKDYSGGEFTWPVPGQTLVTSGYGNRIHPVYGVTRFHSGIDISAPSGTTIVAVADGTVVSAKYNGAWGNEILIDHGGGIITQYAHCSSMSVSTGAEVTKGQKVGGVGMTGTATGNHLHFGVSVSGSWASPAGYLNY